MIPKVDAPEKLPHQKARGHGTEQIGDRQSSRTRNPESHEHLNASPQFGKKFHRLDERLGDHPPENAKHRKECGKAEDEPRSE
jgi:hypothetical protein